MLTDARFWMLTQLSFVSPAEGVLQAEKDFNLASHPEIEGIPNLQVSSLSRI